MSTPGTGRVIRLADNDTQRFHGHVVDTTGKLTLKQAASKTGFSTWSIRDWTLSTPPKVKGWKLPIEPGSGMKCIWVDEQEVIAYAASRKQRAETTSTVHIHWTVPERERVAEEFAVLRLTEPFASVTELLRRAQETGLTEERRKKNLMLANEPVLRKLMAEKWEAAVNSTSDIPVIIREPKVEPVLDITRSLEEAPLDELCGVAMRRYVKSITDVRSFNLNLPVSPAIPSAPTSIEAPTSSIQIESRIEKVLAKKPKFKIAILGLFRQQFEDLSKKVQYDDLELVHVAMVKDRSPGSVPPSVDFADRE